MAPTHMADLEAVDQTMEVAAMQQEVADTQVEVHPTLTKFRAAGAVHILKVQFFKMKARLRFLDVIPVFKNTQELKEMDLHDSRSLNRLKKALSRSNAFVIKDMFFGLFFALFHKH